MIRYNALFLLKFSHLKLHQYMSISVGFIFEPIFLLFNSRGGHTFLLETPRHSSFLPWPRFGSHKRPKGVQVRGEYSDFSFGISLASSHSPLLKRLLYLLARDSLSDLPMINLNCEETKLHYSQVREARG